MRIRLFAGALHLPPGRSAASRLLSIWVETPIVEKGIRGGQSGDFMNAGAMGLNGVGKSVLWTADPMKQAGEVVRCGGQSPFRAYCFQASTSKLAHAALLFQDSEHRFD